MRRIADPSLPGGVEALAAHIEAPAELTRRLKQIGVVPRERGAELASQLKAGQRLVSLEGDLWRWDGFVAAAHAPSGAARRLAERARLVEIETELEQAAPTRRAARQDSRPPKPRSNSRPRPRRRRAMASSTPSAASMRRANCTAGAEREINRHAARQSALTEARAPARPRSRRGADRLSTPSRRRWPAAAARSSRANPELARVAKKSWPPHRMPPKSRAEAQALAREAETRRPPPASDQCRARRMAGAQGPPPRRSRPSTAAPPRPAPSAPSSQTRRKSFAEKRRALVAEIETAEAARREAADALAAGRDRDGRGRSDGTRRARPTRLLTRSQGAAPRSGSTAPSAAPRRPRARNP